MEFGLFVGDVGSFEPDFLQYQRSAPSLNLNSGLSYGVLRVGAVSNQCKVRKVCQFLHHVLLKIFVKIEPAIGHPIGSAVAIALLFASLSCCTPFDP